MLELCMLASGSAGNAVYIGTEKTKILIDAGLAAAPDCCTPAVNTDASCLDALFISHEHTDHIRGAGVLSRRYKLPVYATAATWETAGRQLEEVPKDLPGTAGLRQLFFRGLEIETFPFPTMRQALSALFSFGKECGGPCDRPGTYYDPDCRAPAETDCLVLGGKL